jgi:alpha-N-acetylglucosaminidase
MAKVWYEEQQRLFGKANYFAGDLFHEGGNIGDLKLTIEASRVQEAMLKANPKAIWLITAWGKNPHNDLLNGLKKENTLVVDLCGEYWDTWRIRKGFNGFPWIWSNISNWGGNIGLHGRLDAIAKGPIEGHNDSIANFSMTGVGATPEAIETNPVVFDLANEMRWHKKSPDMETWIANYAKRRYGKDMEEITNAWEIFYKTAYGTYPNHRRSSESVFCARPSLKGNNIRASAFGQCNIFYDPYEFNKGVELLLSKADELKSQETYQYDVVDLVRQSLSNCGRIYYNNVVEAFNNKDVEKFTYWSEKFLAILLDQDLLLSTYPQFCLSTWINRARNYSENPQIQDLHEYNARLQITTWTETSSRLRDYANKEWAGMLEGFYYPRWKMFFENLKKELKGEETEKSKPS